MPTFPNVTEATFDGPYYLANNPDVAAYITANPNGAFKSAWDHFAQGGYAENRPWRIIAVTTTPTDILTANPSEAAFVNQLYRGYFGRAPDDAGWRFWVNEIVSARKTRAGVEDAFRTDHEAVEYARTRQPATTPTTPSSPPIVAQTGSFLDGTILGIPTKLILVGVVGYLLLGKK